MNPVVAASLLACCAALWIQREAEPRPTLQKLAQGLACCVVAIGLVKLTGCIAGFDTGIDTFMFRYRLGGNQMAPNTAGCLVLIGVSLALLDVRIYGFGIAPFTAMAAGAVAFVAVAGYAYAILSFYGLGRYIPMALNSALALMALCAAVLCSRPEVKPVAALLGRWSVERSIAIGFAGALLMLCMIGLVAYHTSARVIQDNVEANRGSNTAAALDELDTLIVNAETGQRGYLLTGDEGYLQPYTVAIAAIDNRVALLRAAVARHPDEARRLAILEPLIQMKLAELRRTVTLRREKGVDAAVAVVRTGEGRLLMHQIRSLLDETGAAERQLAEQMNGEEDAYARRTLRTVLLGMLTTFALVLGCAMLIRRGIRAQRLVEESLREREQEYRATFELAGVGKVQCDATSGRFLRVNQKFCELIGYSADELLRMSFPQITHPDEPIADWSHFGQMARGDNAQYTDEKRYVRKDGQVIWGSVNASMVWDADGRPLRTIAIVQDVTETRRTAELREEAASAAKAANESKSLFLANMSHEIRTPMSAILGYADMLLEPNQSEAERIERVQTIRQNANHLLTVLNDILDLSKIEAGKLDVESIPTSPRQIVGEVISLMRVRAIEKGILLNLTFAGPVPQTIRTDPTRLRQVLLNLIGNAIKFTAAGSVHVIVTLANDDTQTGQPLLEVTVIDSGVGMNPDQVQKLFRPFQQADGSTTRRFGGTGLGLTICRRLAQMLGGDIEVRSRPGTGSRFVLRIQTGDLTGVPLLQEHGESLTHPAQHVQDPALSIRLRGRVLLAEDGVHNQKVLCFYLQKTGIEVTVVENGRQACDAVSRVVAPERPFDLILMDMQMPEMDGYTAAATLRSGGYGGPIIALTAHAMAHDRSRCLQSGCTDYLTKPIDRKRLLQALVQHLPKQGRDSPASPADVRVAVPLRSEIAADEVEITSLLNGFIADLPNQVSRLLKLSAESDLAALREVAHQMKGTGGMYGFAPITEAAETLEQQLDSTDDIQKVQEEIRRLIGVIRRIEGYDAAQEDRLTPR